MRKLASIAASALVLAVIMVTSNTAAASDCGPEHLTVYGPQGYPVADVWFWQGGFVDGFNWACFGPCGPGQDPNSIYYLNDVTFADPNMFGYATTLCEYNSGACDATQGRYSDIFGVFAIDGNYYLGVNSDRDGFPAAFGSEGFFFWKECPEGWRCQYDATFYLDPSLQAAGYTARLATEFTPEPGTLMLLGAGLLGIATSIKRKPVK